MNKILNIIIISIISLTIISCSSSDESASTTSDTTAPVIAEVTAVTTPTNDTTPDYTFSSSEQELLHMGEAAPVPLHRLRQVITQSRSAHSVTAPMITAQSW